VLGFYRYRHKQWREKDGLADVGHVKAKRALRPGRVVVLTPMNGDVEAMQCVLHGLREAVRLRRRHHSALGPHEKRILVKEP
jgi:hypothetical protein